MKINWTPNPRVGPRAVGNFLGFQSASENIFSVLGKYAQVTDDASTVVRFDTPALLPDPVAGKFNVAYTMYENGALPADLSAKISKYDLIIVPSRWCADVFRRFTRRPVEICPLGVDLESFPFTKRKYAEGDKFRFLYVGAPNPRKFTILPDLYRMLISKLPNAEMYIKTTGADLSPSTEMVMRGGAQRDGEIVKSNGWVVDNRKLSQEGLAEIYQSSSAMLLPTCGEGFGLSGLEAMASGLPLIVSDYSGVREYANSHNSTLIKCDYGDHQKEFRDIGLFYERVLDNEPMAYHVGWPNIRSATLAIWMVYSNYNSAVRKARRGRSKAEFMTWDSTARNLCAILKKYGIV